MTVIALIVAGGGLALAGSALLPGESRQGSGGAPIVGPTPSGVFPSVIPDETPGGPKNLFAEHYPDPTLPGQEIEFAVDWKNPTALPSTL